MDELTIPANFVFYSYGTKAKPRTKIRRGPGQVGWWAGWLAGCLAGSLGAWSAGWLAGWLAGWPAGCLAGWLAGLGFGAWKKLSLFLWEK